MGGCSSASGSWRCSSTRAEQLCGARAALSGTPDASRSIAREHFGTRFRALRVPRSCSSRTGTWSPALALGRAGRRRSSTSFSASRPLDTELRRPGLPGGGGAVQWPGADADTIVHGLLLSFNLLLLPSRARRSSSAPALDGGGEREQVRRFVFPVAAVMVAFPLFLLLDRPRLGVRCSR